MTRKSTFGSYKNLRQFNLAGVRVGFNSKENDNEVKGTGNQQDYGERIYDPRLGRFLSIDPLVRDYPYKTPYDFAENRPIDGIDLDGAERFPTIRWRNTRPAQRTANWLEIEQGNNRSNNNRGPKPRTWSMPPAGGAYEVVNTGETFSGEVNSKFPTRGTIGKPAIGSYNSVEAMQIIGKAIENAQEYIEKTKVVAPADYNENTGASYSEVTVTEIYVKIPKEVQKLEESYQANIKSSTLGKQTQEEFNKLPIEEQNARYNSAKFINGPSPKDQFVKLAKEKYNNPNSNSTSVNTNSGTSITSGNSNNSNQMPAVTTYR